MGVLSYFGLKKEEALAPGPADDYWYGQVGSQTAAGVRVDESVAMTYSACWAATRLLAGTGGMLPFNLYRKSGGGGSEIAREHPVHRLLHDEPNPEMAAMIFRSSRINQQVNSGNCFAEIVRNKAGTPVALWPIHASRIPPRNIVRKDGRLLYIVKNDDGTTTPIWQENMLHVPSMISDDGIVGRGVVENARLSIGFGIATETHGAAYFGNSARPHVVIEGGKFRKPEDAEEYRRQWAEVHGGPANNAKPAFLPPDSKIHVLQFNAQDSQFLESRQHSVEEIARWYGVPPHLIGHLLRSTNNNIEHQGIEFVKYSLMPWLKLWEQEVWRKLLSKDEQKTYYAKFVVDALERGDKPTRTAANVQEFFNGLLTLNQWAEREDMNPIGPLGDLHFVQQAMVPLEIAAKGPQQEPKPAPEPEPEHDDMPPEEPMMEPKEDAMSALIQQIESLRAELAQATTAQQRTQQRIAQAMLKEAMGRMLSIETQAIKHIAEKPAKFTQRLQEFYDKHAVTMTRSLSEPVSVVLTACGDAREPAEVVQTITRSHVDESMRQVLGAAECQPEQLSTSVSECLASWSERTTVSV